MLYKHLIYKIILINPPFIRKDIDVMNLRLETTDAKICLCRRPPLDQNPLQASLNPKAWLLSGGQIESRACMHR